MGGSLRRANHKEDLEYDYDQETDSGADQDHETLMDGIDIEERKLEESKRGRSREQFTRIHNENVGRIVPAKSS